MIIYRPIKTDRMTQGFGENRACAVVQSNGKPYLPWKIVPKKNNKCESGTTEFYSLLGLKGHAGMDFSAKKREPIYFDIDGAKDVNGKEVEWEVQPGYSATGGYYVMIRSKSPVALKKSPDMPGASLNLVKRQYEQNGGAVHLMRYYGHLDEASHLKSRQTVKFGDKVGLAGTTGASSGVHVHRHLLVVGSNEQGPFFYLGGDSDYKGRIDEVKEGWIQEDFVLDVVKAKKQAMTAIELAQELIKQVAEYLKGRN